MSRLFNLMMLAVVGGGGWMFLKGLHLEDVKQIFATSGQQQPYNQTPYGNGQYNSSTGGTVTAGGGGGYSTAAWNPGANATIRVAAFNIQVFGEAKADTPHVFDTLALVASQFDVLAIQEIRTKYGDVMLQKFVRRIYELSGGKKQFDYRIGPRLGNTTSKEQYAFLFDVQKVQIHPTHVYTITDTDNLLHREPMVAMFATRGVPIDQAFTFILVNVHTDPDVADDEMDSLAQVYNVVRRNSGGEDDVIMLGDFNTRVPAAPPTAFGRSSRSLKPSDLYALGDIPGIYPVVRNEPTNVIRTQLHDNILIHRPSTTEFTGQGGVYDIGQQHGLTLEQVKQVSDHLPVWAEFSITESGLPGRVASGAGGAVR